MNKVYIIIICGWLIAVHGLKNYQNYHDLGNYKLAFEYLTSSEAMRFEPAYMLLNECVRLFSGDFQVFLVVTSVLIVGGISISIWKWSSIPWLSFLVWMLTQYGASEFILRQALAVTVSCNLLGYIVERKQVKFLLGMVLAICLHYSAVVFVPIYYVYNFRLNSRFFYVLAIATVIGFAVNVSLASFMTVYERYLTHKTEGPAIMNILFIGLILLLYAQWYPKSKLKSDGIDKLLFVVLICTFSLSLMTYGIDIGRVHWYYRGLLYLIVPNLLVNIKDKLTKVVCGLIILSLLSYGCFKNGISDYSFFWEKKITQIK